MKICVRGGPYLVKKSGFRGPYLVKINSYGEKMTSSFIGSKWLRLWATMNLCLGIALFIYATAHLISKCPELVGLLDHPGR